MGASLRETGSRADASSPQAVSTEGFDPARIADAFNKRLAIYRAKRDAANPFAEDTYNRQDATRYVDAWIERTRARILRDTDPAVVAEHSRRMKAWAERIGHPKRCKVGEAHPASGECLYCGAANGQTCLLGFGG